MLSFVFVAISLTSSKLCKKSSSSSKSSFAKSKERADNISSDFLIIIIVHETYLVDYTF